MDNTDDLKSIKVFDVQGHRGCRGLLPENTIPGFMHAMDLRVSTLEMDVVISKDHKVVVSHEPFFNHEISTHPNNFPITEDNELEFNIYELDYADLRKFDVGKKDHPRFKKQEKLATYKPLLSELVSAVKHKAEELNVPVPYFNIEIKRSPKFDSIYHPTAETFARLVTDVVRKSGIADKTTIQCFDTETLEILHKDHPEFPLVYLVSKKSGSKNLKKLSFTPAIYSPHYLLVDKKLVKLCKKKDMKLIPWTVNKKGDMKKLIKLGVDGIISDYPDKLIKIIEHKSDVLLKK